MPTPMPALAPVLRPPDNEGLGVGEGGADVGGFVEVTVEVVEGRVVAVSVE